MSRTSYKRASSIDADFTTLEKNLPKAVSDLARDTELAIQMTGLLHDNILNSKGDLDEGDRANFNASFSSMYTSLMTTVTKLQDCYAVYNDDPDIYAQNLVDFITKYPNASVDEVEKRYS